MLKQDENKHSLNFLCKYKSSDLHKSFDISIKMYQMNDKVFLTKKKEKNKLKTLSLISVIAFYMFFAYAREEKAAQKKEETMNRAAFISFTSFLSFFLWDPSWGKSRCKGGEREENVENPANENFCRRHWQDVWSQTKLSYKTAKACDLKWNSRMLGSRRVGGKFILFY